MAGAYGCFFHGSLEEYEAHRLGHASDAQELYDETAQALSLKGASQLLDLGCGTGRELDAILKNSPWISVTGVDASAALLAKLLAKPYASRLSLIDCKSVAMQLGSAAFDAAVSVLFMHHMSPDDRLTLYKKIYASLRPGGRYVEADWYAQTQTDEDRHKALWESGGTHIERPITAENAAELMRAAGFQSVVMRWQQKDKAIYVARKEGPK